MSRHVGSRMEQNQCGESTTTGRHLDLQRFDGQLISTQPSVVKEAA